MISVQALFELQTDTFIIISAFSEFPYQKNVHTNQIDSVARRKNSRMHKPFTASMIIIINANRLHEGRKKKPKKSVLHPSVASFFISHTLSLALFIFLWFFCPFLHMLPFSDETKTTTTRNKTDESSVSLETETRGKKEWNENEWKRKRNGEFGRKIY